MSAPRLRPVGSEAALRSRVSGLLKYSKNKQVGQTPLFPELALPEQVELPAATIASFLDFVNAALPDGDVYLFGGVLRDLAMYGRAGFSSDIDLVVEGDWTHLESYLVSKGAIRNKFGGFRLTVAGWPVDIWNAEGTWAIRNELVKYDGIPSLTETTVTNWDAILMSWRTGQFVFRRRYFEQMAKRELDIVLEENPNPLGMAVRVLRHFCQKDAMCITTKAAQYLADCARRFDFETIKLAEIESYGNSLVMPVVHRYFLLMGDSSLEGDVRKRFGIAGSLVKRELELQA